MFSRDCCPVNQSPGPGLEAKVIPECHTYNKQTNKQTALDLLQTFNEFTEHKKLFQEVMSSLDNQTVSPYQHCPGRVVRLLDVSYLPLPSTEMTMNRQEDILRNLQTWKTLKRNLVATLPQLKTASRLVKFRPPWTYLEVFFLCISSLFVTTISLCLLACVCCLSLIHI